MQSVLGVIHRAGLLRRSDAERTGVIHRAGLLRRSDAGSMRVIHHRGHPAGGHPERDGAQGGMPVGWRVRPKNEILIP